MADLVTGAMSSLIPKLFELLKEEYNLQTGVKERIKSLTQELESAKEALDKVAEVPWDQLDKQVKRWAREVRESSYDMEDVLDTFLVHVQGRDSTEKEGSLKRLGEKIRNLFKKSKARRKISVSGKDIMTHLHEVTERCRRYKVDDIVARPATTTAVDPRLAAMYNKEKNLIGIDKSSGDLISMLRTQQQGDVPDTRLKIVSVVGVGGLGKTTLAKAVYDKLKGDFEHSAFVPVGRNPDLKKVFKDILIDLDKHTYLQYSTAILDEKQLIDELRSFFLAKKRSYVIVIDDIWEVQSWKTIKLAFDGDDDNNRGPRIIITTRKIDVAAQANAVYKLQPLSDDSSRELFYARMFADEGSHVDNELDEISNKILKKCGGIPLAIITMASLLAGKPKDKWYEIYKNIGFGSKDSIKAENPAMKILSFSYYDLPLHLRTCLLYVSAFPEDSMIDKGTLIWKWVAEGFVHEQQGTWLFETGEGYFNDLINRSLIQGEEKDYVVIGCRVHDIVLDFIRSMSHEENFFTILENNGQDTLSKRPPVRRLAHHNRTMRHDATHQANNHLTDALRTVRSFSAQGCAIESWATLCSFALLRVLAIEECNLVDGCRLRVEHVGHLLHLRYLSLRRSYIQRIPEEIGCLKFLQTLDVEECDIVETPSGSSLPTQLACLRITFKKSSPAANNNCEVGWVGRLTSLEELRINRRCQWKEFGSLRRLRVLMASIAREDAEGARDFVDAVSHLDKLQHLEIRKNSNGFQGSAKWEAAVFVLLPRQLRLFYVLEDAIEFRKLPPCINAGGLPNLSHLEICLRVVDEQDLRKLGGLPELRHLCLSLSVYECSTAISNITNNDSKNGVCYFPKLRSFQLRDTVVLLFVVANSNNKDKEEEVVSFHLWDGWSDISVPPLFDSKGDGDQPRTSIMSATAASTDDDHESKETGTTTAPHRLRFMPSLQVLKFQIRGKAAVDHRYCDNLMGWEHLSSLREIGVHIPFTRYADMLELEKVYESLRRAADEHPNRPTIDIKYACDYYSKWCMHDAKRGNKKSISKLHGEDEAMHVGSGGRASACVGAEGVRP